MVRKISLTATSVVLVMALVSILASGCGGGGGPAEGGQALTGSRFGQLALRVVQGTSDRLEVTGREVLLQVSSPSTHFLRVELFPLPLATPPAASLTQEFEIVGDTTTVTVREIPPGSYLLVLTSLDSEGQPLANFETEVVIQPGVVASIQASLTPVSSPTVTPTPSPTPGAITAVTTAQVPADRARIAMSSSGQYVITWRSQAFNPVQVVGTSFDAAGTPRSGFQDLVVSNLPVGYDLLDHSLAISNDGQVLVAFSKRDISPMMGYLDYTYVDALTGTFLEDFITLSNGVNVDFRHLSAALTPTAVGGRGAVSRFDANVPSSENLVVSTFNAPPSPPGEPSTVLFNTGPINSFYSPSMAMDGSGNIVTVSCNRFGGSLDLVGTLIELGGIASSNFNVELGLPAPPEADVAIGASRILVTWSRAFGGEEHVFYALYSYDPADVTVAPTVLHSGQVSTGIGVSNLDPDSAINPSSGSFTILWTNYPGVGPSSRQLARAYRVDGTPGTVFEPSAGAGTQNTGGRIGMDGSGNFRVTWSDPSTGALWQRPFPAGFGLP